MMIGLHDADCVSQTRREESQRQDSAVGRCLERTDTTGAMKQTASGRIEMRVTKNFSVVMDEEMFNEMQRQRQKLPTVETPR